ncbi:hypothetical protein [Ideonella sp. BN130291]|uniref:hypothetical protein n=1 Tax=Ideonella sp. BN130291 TaxID=3112940 RepID=UPI002E275719|nr:hypothetical protein [Ideonella sp. BN130291]
MAIDTRRFARITTLAAAAAALAACGGGGGDDTPAPPPPPPPPPAVQAVQGTAAVGGALAHATVSVVDTTGASVCTESAIVTSDTGTYTCTLQAGKTAPFVVVVTDAEGAVAPLVSVGTSTPVAGTPATVNATPLTTAIVAQLSPDRSALTVAAQPASIDVAALQSITVNVLAQLADVVASVSAPANYNPFTTPIVAATTSTAGDAADKVLEVLKISTVNGETVVATVDKPDQAVPLATTIPATVVLAAPAPGVATLSQELSVSAIGLQRCFSVDLPQRVISADSSIALSDGGPEVTQAADECNEIVTNDYLHNGYSSGQHFYGLLNDPAMTGAVFSVPEVMRFIAASSSVPQDRAVVNLRYVDKNGVAGNIITVAYKFAGSSSTAHPTEWWLHGNRHPIDSSVQASIRRREQLAPNPGTAPFPNAPSSRYETGLNIFINKDGPGSSGMRAVRVTGPGLPPAGLVYTRPDPALALSQNWMNIKSKNGVTDPASATFSANVGNVFLLQRTQGISGADASTVRPNPNQSNGNNTQFVNWAHPVDYGAAPGSSNYIDFTQLKAHNAYHFEVFYDGETAPRHSYDSTPLTPVAPASYGGALQWVDLTPATKGYLDPGNVLAAATQSIGLSWNANPYAETIRSAGVYTYSGSGPVNQGLVSVARGATTATAAAPAVNGVTVPFPTLTSDGSTGRQLQLRYRTLDGSYKDSMTQYN